jgi:hypothetical protein
LKRFRRRAVELKGHWRGEVGEIAFPATKRDPARGQRRERIGG